MSLELGKSFDTSCVYPSKLVHKESFLSPQEQLVIDISRAGKLILKSDDPSFLYCDLSNVYPTDYMKAMGQKYPLRSLLPSEILSYEDLLSHGIESGKIEKTTFRKLLDLTIYAASTLNKPVELQRTQGYSSITLSRVSPNTTLESRLIAMKQMRAEIVSILKTPNTLKIYTFGSLEQDDPYAADVDVAVIVGAVDAIGGSLPQADFLRFESYTAESESTWNNRNLPGNFFESKTVSSLYKIPEDTGVPLHLTVLTKQAFETDSLLAGWIRNTGILHETKMTA